MFVITCLRDRVADRFLNINLEQNTKTACRSFVNALAAVRDDTTHPIVANPEDFDLMYLAEFDEATGKIRKNDVRVLMTGVEVFDELDFQASDLSVRNLDLDFQTPVEEY